MPFLGFSSSTGHFNTLGFASKTPVFRNMTYQRALEIAGCPGVSGFRQHGPDARGKNAVPIFREASIAVGSKKAVAFSPAPGLELSTPIPGKSPTAVLPACINETTV